jgi:hypothetical protein
LKRFLSAGGGDTKQSSKKVGFGELLEYWSSRPNANREVVSEYLAHLGKLLAQAKNLRNDNNYEVSPTRRVLESTLQLSKEDSSEPQDKPRSRQQRLEKD